MSGAALNVLVNTRLMRDRVYARKLNDEVDRLTRKYGPIAKTTYEQVYQKLKKQAESTK